MSHFTTKCHYTTASLQHRMSFRNAHPITSSNLRCSSCSCLCFSHRQEAAAKANSLTCRFYTVILTKCYNPVFIFFFLSPKWHNTVESEPIIGFSSLPDCCEISAKGAREREIPTEREFALCLPYPERRLVNVVVGLCVMGCGLRVMFEAQQMQGLWLEIVAQRHSALTV